MCVRALRITVLKSAGNFTRGECDDLGADKIHRVKCFMFTRYGIVARQQFSSAGAAGGVRKFQGLPRKQTSDGRIGMSVDCPAADVCRLMDPKCPLRVFRDQNRPFRSLPLIPQERSTADIAVGPVRARSRYFGRAAQRPLSPTADIKQTYPLLSPWPDASGSSPSPRASTVRPDRSGRGASTLTSQGRNLHALQDASGRMVVKL